MIRLGFSDASDFSGELTDLALVDTADRDFVLRGTFDSNAVFLYNLYGVRETNVKNELVALFCNLPTYAVYDKALFVTFRKYSFFYA